MQIQQHSGFRIGNTAYWKFLSACGFNSKQVTIFPIISDSHQLHLTHRQALYQIYVMLTFHNSNMLYANYTKLQNKTQKLSHVYSTDKTRPHPLPRLRRKLINESHV